MSYFYDSRLSFFRYTFLTGYPLTFLAIPITLLYLYFYFLFLFTDFSPDQTQYHRDRNIRQCIAYRDVYSHQDPVQDEADYPQYHIGDLNFFFAVIFL